MELSIVREYKRKLEKKIAELLKEYEKNTALSINDIIFTRQSMYDNLGNETEFKYAVDIKSNI